LNTFDILCPEVNVRSSHKIQTTSISMSGIAREAAALALAGELKTGPKTQKLIV
jgi:hypothetical protein